MRALIRTPIVALRGWLQRLVSSWRPSRSDDDLEAELRLHLELATAHEARRGLPADAARRAAGVRVGLLAGSMESVRDQRGLPWLHDLGRDARYGLRGVARSPLFAGVIVLSLALGIGANTALFSLIDAAFLRDLPVHEPDRLVQLRWRARHWAPSRSRLGGPMVTTHTGERYSPAFPSAAVDLLRSQATTLVDVLAFDAIRRGRTVIDGRAGLATTQKVSANFFTALGLAPAVGRLLVDLDDRAFDRPAIVISDRYWRLQFDRDPGVVGRLLAVDGVSVTIVGVAPESIRMSVSRATGSDRRVGGVAAPDIWIPLGLEPLFGGSRASNGDWWLSVLGRMAPGVTAAQVEGNLGGVLRGIVETWEGLPSEALIGLEAISARRGAPELGLEASLTTLLTLAVVCCALLLIVCLNVANLLLSRGASRRAEISIRLTMGASRWRLVRQLLTEHLTLALIAGVLGIVGAFWGKSLFAAVAVVSPDLELRIDARVVGVATVISIATGLLFGLVPAMRATRIREGRAMERLQVAQAPPSTLNRTLLVAQVALSIVLLGGAGLFAQSLGYWRAEHTGFDTGNLLVFHIDPDVAGVTSGGEGGEGIVERILGRIAVQRSVLAATASGPFWESAAPATVSVHDSRGAGVGASGMRVRHDFFRTLRLPIVAGRSFTAGEDVAPPGTVILDEVLAEALFGLAMPLGRQIEFRGRVLEVVGVATRPWMPGPRLEMPRPVLYLPFSTRPSDFQAEPGASVAQAPGWLSESVSILVRTTGDPMSSLPAMRKAVREVASQMPLMDPTSVDAGIAERLGPTQVTSLIWLSFGGMALVLTAVGLYGILAGNVARRTQEIGIRTALGADRWQIVRLVAGETAALVVVGIVLGTFGSLEVNEVIRAAMFGVATPDPVVTAGIAGLVILVAACAAVVPSRRALSLNPTVALRSDAHH